MESTPEQVDNLGSNAETSDDTDAENGPTEAAVDEQS